MPIYEFRCDGCGSRFEELVPVGGRAERCPECGAADPERRFSPQAPPFHLARAPSEMRKQERTNAKLRETTKARFKAARRRASERNVARGGDGG